MTNIICNECETVAHCMNNGCVPKQPAYRAVKTYHEGKPVYVAEQPAQQEPVPWSQALEDVWAIALHLEDVSAEQPAQQALNKMAENARELGLDYEPDIPFGDNNPGLPWDEVPQAFNDWWNADYDPTGNPFEKDTHAYWAWAGWKAAEQPAQQEPVAWMYQCSADNSGPVLMQHKQDWAKSGSGLWTEAPLFTSPPLPEQKPVELCQYGQEPASCTSNPMDCQCAIDAALAQPEPSKPN